MNKKEKASVISIGVNVFLSLSKLGTGFLAGSAALIADGIHSGLDVLSSFVSFFGIKASQREKDEKHPYGYYNFENIASLAIVFLLLTSAIWIIYEGVEQLVNFSAVKLSIWGFGAVIISIIANELMARYKFKIGQEEDSLSLVADAQHSRADVVSSVGVLLGLVLVRFFPLADGILAVLIGFYIIYETRELGAETIDQLVGVKDEEVEKGVKKILKEKKVELSDIKTRKIGSAGFAEITIKLSASLSVKEAENKTKALQKELVDKINRLDQVVIQVESHDYSSGAIRPIWGSRINWEKRLVSPQELGVKEKKGYRTIVPVKEDKIFDNLGAPQYLIIDKEEEEVKQKKTINNPYLDKDKGGGMKIIRTLDPDEIISPFIGEGVKEKIKEANIKITKTEKGGKVQDILNI